MLAKGVVVPPCDVIVPQCDVVVTQCDVVVTSCDVVVADPRAPDSTAAGPEDRLGPESGTWSADFITDQTGAPSTRFPFVI
jgi:hypothetical protein